MAILAGNSAGNLLKGTSGQDRIEGLAGNDTLDGGSGADSLYGGTGNDSYYVNITGDVVVETTAGSAGGKDIVYSAVSFTLGANLENLQLYTTAISGTGNALANSLTGNAAGNVLSGMDGIDTLFGGDGDDSLLGGNGDDWLHGEAGNDSLDGGSGSDHMAGGAGDDSYYVNATGDVVVETISGSAGGADTVYSAVAFTLGANIENLRLYKTAASGTGNALHNHIQGSGTANTLSGLGGNDTLLGGDGADKLLGGDGNDTLAGTVVTASSDWLFGDTLTMPSFGGDTLDGGAGTDTAVFAEVYSLDFKDLSFFSPDMNVNLSTGKASYAGLAVAPDTLISIENVVAGTGDDTIVGSSGDNVIDAGEGFNLVYGGGGNDQVTVGWCLDYTSPGPDGFMSRVYGGEGDDILKGNGIFQDFSYGNNTRGTDYLSGGAGDDQLSQGGGFAVMNGGAGADRFVFHAAGWEVTNGPSLLGYQGSHGTIEDFSRAEGDFIQISIQDDMSDFEGDSSIPTFVGTSKPGLGQIGYAAAGADTVITHVFGPEGYSGDEIALTITLEDFTGKLYASDFDFV